MLTHSDGGKGMENIVIQEFKGTKEDALGIKKIDDLTFKECRYTVEEIIKIGEDKNNKIFIAKKDKNSIGFMSVMAVNTLHYNGLWVDLIAVIPSYQNKKIGKKLLERGKEYANSIDADFISALVRKNNTASQEMFKKDEFKKDENLFNLFFYDKK